MKRLLLFIDGSPTDRESLRYVTQLHQKLNGRLSVGYLRPGEAKVGSVARAIDVAQRAAAAARQAFDETCGALDSTVWLDSEEVSEESLRYQSQLHDLTVLARVLQDEGSDVFALNTALFDSGGPVLVSPPEPPMSVAERVALVWSPSAQSARVTRSSIPILKQAKSVVIMTNSERPEARPEDLQAYLASHGIAAEAQVFDAARTTARGRGRVILSAVADIGADLLVMGAYGENRLISIFGLGRTTQKIVSGAPIPVLVQR